MPNGVKYSPTTPSGSLKRGNVSLGVTDNLGPTSTTGFYSMPTPQNGKYIINKVSPSNIPNFFSPQNDAELIRLARQEGATGADTGSAAAVLAWIALQDNLEAANFEYPNIVTNGLIFNIDAGFVGSYPTTGTTWYDLSGYGFNTIKNVGNFNSNGYFTSVETPGYASLLEFTTTISGALNTAMSVTSGGWCIEEWILINDTTYPEAGAGTVVSDAAYPANTIGFDWNHGQTNMTQLQMGASWNIGQGDGYDVRGYITLESQFQSYGKWYLRHLYWNRNTAKMGAYYNGRYQGDIDISVLNGYPICDGGNISWGQLYGWRHDGARAGMKIYNRILSSSEILQNYNAQAFLGSVYNPASSATAILASNPSAPDGYYWINTNLGAKKIYCLMSLGGWMGMTSELCPQTSNVLTSASWETNTEGRLQSANSSILNVNVVETGCGGTSNYQLQNPSTRGLNYTQAMLLIQRVSTIGQCSDIVNSVGRGYYTGPEYTGTYTSYGMCTWADGFFAPTCCGAQDLTGLKPYWVMLNSGTNPSLYYQVQCAGEVVSIIICGL
jgi:hypothetical protein